jgi:hypothetical protein
MCPSARVFTCGFSMTVRHLTTAVKCVIGPSEYYPGRWIGRGREAPVSWPARSPALLESCKPRSYQ